MTGKIFTLSGRVGGARTAHPHLVAIELSDRYWMVPAFTTGGREVEQYKADLFAAVGLRPDQAFVELDNAVHVTFYDGRPPHEATWVVERIGDWPKSEVKHRRPVGEMDGAGLQKVLVGWLALMDAKPDAFSPHLRKRVNHLLAELLSPPDNG